MTAALFFISVIFSILAAIMAYLITYQEYRHHFPDKRDIKKAALRTGGFTFLLFLFLGMLLAILLPEFLMSS